MENRESETEDTGYESLEHTDTKESVRQLWWTIGVIVLALALMAYFYL